ncbi:MAG: tetratricopeptide repeat protein [Myxococcota bacterium]
MISSSRAYTVAGSFFRYLVDKYGIEKFGVLYASNNFQTAYEQSLDELVTEWETFLKAIPLPQDDLLVAEHRFKRPSIFQKVCPHVAANVASRGYARLRSGDLEGAQTDLEQIYSYAPADPSPLIALAEGLGRAGQFEQARALVERALEAPGATLKGKTQAIEARANLAWREDRTQEAVKDYTIVKKRHLSTPSDRLQQARIFALTRTSTAVTDLMRDVLLGDQGPPRGLARLAEASVTIRNVPLVHYLYARALERAQAYPEGVAAAARAVALDLGDDPLKTEAILTYGRLLWWDDKPHEAAVVFDAVAQDHPSAAITAAAADWADRARFTATKTSTRSPVQTE